MDRPTLRPFPFLCHVVTLRKGLSPKAELILQFQLLAKSLFVVVAGSILLQQQKTNGYSEYHLPSFLSPVIYLSLITFCPFI